jgi:hypothetical protein
VGNSSSNAADTRKQLRGLRRERDEGEAQVIGFEDAGGGSRAVLGDEDAPWLKTPPFTTVAERLMGRVALPPTPGPYLAGTEIQTTNYRLLTLYLDYDLTAAPAGGQLSLVPEAFDTKEQLWRPTGLVDPTVLPVTLSPPFGAGFGSRNFLPAELRGPAFPGVGAFQAALQFDVSPYERFRISVLELISTATSTLLVNYNKSQ